MAALDGYVANYYGSHFETGYYLDVFGDQYSLALSSPNKINNVYIMRAKDENYIGLQYRVWLSRDIPDFDVNYYDGEFSGAEINFSDIVVLAKVKV